MLTFPAFMKSKDSPPAPAARKPTDPPLVPHAVTRIKLKLIQPSQTNQRIFSGTDDASIREIADSILQLGIVVPLIVRPHPKAKGQFELVAGERRFLGAELAKLEEVPCHVAPLSDTEAREVQIIENLGRVNLSELEEGMGYAEMLKMTGGGKPLYTMKTLAERVGKTEQTIYARLKLAAM